MTDRHPLCTIGAAFPIIPEKSLAGLFVGLSPHESIDSLMTTPDAAAAFECLADWMLRHPSTCIGTMLPGLWLARDDCFKSSALPLRVVNALSRLSITVWGEVLELTPSFLLDIRGFGEESLRPFLAVAAWTAAKACCHQAPPKRLPTVDLFEPRRFAPHASFKVSQFKRLVEWAASECDAQTIADVLAASSHPNPPEDIKLLCEALRLTRLSALFSGIPREETMETLVEDLCNVLDKRSRTIFLSRISLNQFRTLDDLALEMGITKQRVQQLWVRAEERIREALATPRFTPIFWRAHTLRTMLGVAIPHDTLHLTEAGRQIAPGVTAERRERVLDIMLWIAGPYARHSVTGWLQAGDIPESDVIATFSDSRGVVDMTRLGEHLTHKGLLPQIQPYWCDQIGKIKCVDGNWLLWTGTVTDKALRLLETWGRPATTEEIVVAIGEGHDVRATRARLQEDDRFIRVDMTRIALRSWGMEEYSTIAEEIDQELERRGGSADVDNLVAALVARFSLREGSIRSYVYAPMFVLEGNTIRRRTSADPYGPVPPLAEVPGCYPIGADGLSWRVEVTADTLRGSGRPLPAAIAAWLSVTPGGRRSLTATGGVVRVTWPETSVMGPSLGSIRFLVEGVSARLGDQLLLRFGRDPGTLAATRIDPVAVSSTQGLQRLALLTGIPDDDKDGGFIHNLGRALGTRGTVASISAALRARGESELAGLVPAEAESPELDAAIDALKDLF